MKNQQLVASIKMCHKGDYYIRLIIDKDNSIYAVDAYRGDFRDFILQDDYFRELCRFMASKNPFASMEDIADDMSYGYQTDGDLKLAYAAQVELNEDLLLSAA